MAIDLKIIDVSEYQGVIDWEKVKAQIDGVIIRCGYGMDNPKRDDACFRRNADECTRLGIPFGVYLYSYADSTEEIKSEAAHVLRLIQGYSLSYPVYLDLEEASVRQGATDRTGIFGDIIENAGYTCGVYANTSWWNNYLKGLDRFTKWVAQYYKECQYKGSRLDMWQYTANGKIDGIKGSVDISHCYRDFPAEIGEKKTKPAEDSPQDGTVTVKLPILQNGKKGISVKALQFLLIGNGCTCGSWGADGSFGSATQQAVKNYQKMKGLAVDGVVGASTWTGLLTGGDSA